MTVSSRTPEGVPSRCVLCGAEVNLEFSDPGDDAPCPNCGSLIWKANRVFEFTERILQRVKRPIDEIGTDTLFEELRTDSIDFVELLLELEHEYGVTIRDEDYERIRTVGDLIRHVVNAPSEKPSN